MKIILSIDGRVAGRISFDADKRKLHGLKVSADYQRQGIGTALIGIAVGRAIGETGPEPIHTYANDESGPLFRSLGFRAYPDHPDNFTEDGKAYVLHGIRPGR